MRVAASIVVVLLVGAGARSASGMRSNPGEFGIFEVRIDGTEPKALLRVDGRRCARGEVRLVRPDGTGLSMWVPRGIAPSWSPDSQRIAFVGHYNPYYRRGVISVAAVSDTSRIRELSSLEYRPGRTGSSGWSPRGDFVT